MKKPLILPHFNNEQEERTFWDNIDLSKYYDPKDARSVQFPNLKKTHQKQEK